ncbi:MAG: hypothetical protein O7J95_22085 [Planctomycetota bacterium]|nr:hypothetical protein [Planctomycetota bacterium]
MNWNREKSVFALASLIFLAGLYHVTVGLITPGPAIHVPDVTLSRSYREVGKPEYRRFQATELPRRNPFRFAAGWRPLEKLPLASPPLPPESRIFPTLGGFAASASDEFIVLEETPTESGGASGKPGGGGGSE